MSSAPAVANQKSKAEVALSVLVDAQAQRLPGGMAIAKLRTEAARQFASRGLPHRRIEEWKFSDVRGLLKNEAAAPVPHRDPKSLAQALVKSHGISGALHIVFVDGKLAHGPTKLPQGLTLDSFAHRIEAEPSLLAASLPDTVDHGAVALIALNASLAADGVLVRIAPGARIEAPIQVIFAGSETIAMRNRVDVGANASATVLETYLALDGGPRAQNYGVTFVTLGEGAALDHVMDHPIAAGVFVFNAIIATLDGSATYRPFQLHMGDGIARHQLVLTFKGEASTFDFGGVSLVGGNGHADTTMVIDHAVPHCTSRELFKTVLNGRGRGIFQGKVIVRPDAQKTDGKQMAQAMMLSPAAEFDAKPELEIYADDVVCGHGATSAEIDPDQLFYLRARGIPEVQARAMLVEGFISEAFDKITHAAIRETLMARAIDWLRQTPDAKLQVGSS